MPNSPSSSSLSGRILLLDDNSMGLSARRSVLEELGHKVITCGVPLDALELCGKQRFDVVVTDYKMPKMNGVEFITRLRKQQPAALRDSDLGLHRHAGPQRSEHRRRRGDPKKLARSEPSHPVRESPAAQAATTGPQTGGIASTEAGKKKSQVARHSPRWFFGSSVPSVLRFHLRSAGRGHLTELRP